MAVAVILDHAVFPIASGAEHANGGKATQTFGPKKLPDPTKKEKKTNCFHFSTVLGRDELAS